MHFVQVTTKKNKGKIAMSYDFGPRKEPNQKPFFPLNGYVMLKQKYTMALSYFTSLYMSFCT